MMVRAAQNGEAKSVFTFVGFDQAGELMLVHTDHLIPHTELCAVTVVSSSSGHMTGNICESHNLFLQSRHNVKVDLLKTVTTPSFRLDCTTVARIGPMERILNVIHSSDGKLFGILQKETYHIWVVASSGCRKVSEVNNTKRYKMVALGHIYSIFLFVSRGLTVTVVVMSTHTGETVWTFVQPPKQQYSCTVGENPDLDFLTVIREEWLNDIHTSCLLSGPFIVFENSVEAKKGNSAVDGLSFC